jgi:hypothetical protein
LDVTKLVTNPPSLKPYGELYDPAMEITTQEEADAYLAELVAYKISIGHDPDDAEEAVRRDLGYYAGYFSDETRKRVDRLLANLSSRRAAL